VSRSEHRLQRARPRSLPQARTLLSLYAGHRQTLIRYAANITGDQMSAEDVVQEAWLRLGATDAQQSLEEPLAYLYRIVRNLALDKRRRQAFEQKHFIDDASEQAAQAASNSPSPERIALARADLLLVKEALDELPENMRVALEMHRLGGVRLKDIAAHLGVSLTTAHGLVAEGVYRCRLKLGRRDDG